VTSLNFLLAALWVLLNPGHPPAKSHVNRIAIPTSMFYAVM